MSPPSCPAGPSRPAPSSASTCRSPPPCSARATTPSPRTSCCAGPERRAPARSRPDGAARRRSPTAGSRPSSPDQRGPAGRSASRRGATRWPPGATPSRSRSTPARAPRSSPTTWRTAPGCSTRVAADADAERPTATLLVAAADALRDTAPELTARVAPGARPGRAASTCTSTRCASWSPATAALRGLGRPAAGAFGSWYEFFPRSEGAGRRRTAARRTARSPRAAERLPAVADDGLRRRLPAADPPDRHGQPQGPQQHPDARARTTSARRGRSARAEGGHDADPPASWARSTDFDAFVARARELGMEVALDFALQSAPDHPWVDRAPGVVHHRARRHDRLRGEPAEEVPGHLPDQLRQRPRGHLRRVPAGRAALDRRTA